MSNQIVLKTVTYIIFNYLRLIYRLFVVNSPQGFYPFCTGNQFLYLYVTINQFLLWQ